MTRRAHLTEPRAVRWGLTVMLAGLALVTLVLKAIVEHRARRPSREAWIAPEPGFTRTFAG